ncbi:MAG: hypothetical protein AAF368_07370, partial [Planctomycetota bacterium]
ADMWRIPSPAQLRTPFGVQSPKLEDELQVIRSKTLEPIIETSAGAVLSRMQNNDIYILSDPDLVNTFGLAEIDNARFAVDLVNWMKFGYDRMTREFRNSAACAIFIVKSDNLFLEQVFAEFEDLLQLFSRIFLVVNLDSSKMDLKPDGSLVPSLEQSDPDRIIEAFENLAMSGPIKEATDDGRLRIYPVDLLRSASRRLLEQNGEAQTEADSPTLVSFDTFLGDLTDYLNSTDYLHHFLGDSLRRATQLFDETKTLCDSDGIRELAKQTDALDARAIEVKSRIAALDRLAAYDWRRAFLGLQKDLAKSADERADAVEEKTAHALDGALESWFESDASLHDLIEGKLGPVLSSYQDEVALHVHKALDEKVTRGNAGIEISRERQDDLDRAEIGLGQIGRQSIERIELAESVGPISPPMRAGDIPVRKRLLDWIFFRSNASVRRKMFGPPDRPSVRIPKAQKAKRLGAAGKETMRAALDEYRGSFFPLTVQRLTDKILGSYGLGSLEALESEVKTRKAAAQGELETIQSELKEFQKLQNHITELERQIAGAHGGIEQLSEQYVATEPDDLIQPFSAGQIEESVEEAAENPEETKEALSD